MKVSQEILKEILKNFPGCTSEWKTTPQMQCFHDINYMVIKKNHCTATLGYFIFNKKLTVFLIHGDWSLRKERMKEETPLFMGELAFSKQNKFNISPYTGKDIQMGNFSILEFELFEKITLVLYNYAKHVVGKQ